LPPKDSWAFRLAIVGSLASILSLVAQLVPAAKVVPYLVEFAPLATFLGMFVAATAFFIENRRLRLFVHDGLQFTYNSSTVSVDHAQKRYRLRFEKHFRVLSSDRAKWYKGQFYCNRILTDDEATRKFYEANTPKWGDLRFTASLKRKGGNGTGVAPLYRLGVRPLVDEGFYIPFHIDFAEEGSDSEPISMPKGTEWILQYSYEVSAQLWGSYLNRSLSFFGERGKVIFEHSEIVARDSELQLCEIKPPSGTPQLVSRHRRTDLVDGNVRYEVDLPPKSCARYRIRWDS
jgi:hypothetical protein